MLSQMVPAVGISNDNDIPFFAWGSPHMSHVSPIFELLADEKFIQRKADLEARRIPNPMEKVSVGRISRTITSGYYPTLSVYRWYRTSFFLSWEALDKQD